MQPISLHGRLLNLSTTECLKGCRSALELRKPTLVWLQKPLQYVTCVGNSQEVGEYHLRISYHTSLQKYVELLITTQPIITNCQTCAANAELLSEVLFLCTLYQSMNNTFYILCYLETSHCSQQINQNNLLMHHVIYYSNVKVKTIEGSDCVMS